MDDIKINLIDTAGIQETDDKVEKIGIDKAKNLIGSADIILFLIDTSREFSVEDEKIFNQINGSKHIVVKTKSDLTNKCDRHFENEIEISNISGSGTDKLKAKILQFANISSTPAGSVIITNERHKEALKSALESLNNAYEGISAETLDLVSVDIKSAYSEIGEITGNTASEDIIDAIFKKFCLGK